MEVQFMVKNIYAEYEPEPFSYGNTIYGEK